MTSMPSPVRRMVLWGCAVLVAFVLVAFLWALRWMERDNLRCVRWRFTVQDGSVIHGEVWSARGGNPGSDDWEKKISNLSGQLETSVPLVDDLPWYKKAFQSFRIEKRVPYKNGFVHGMVVHLGPDGHETHIEQFRDGQPDGLACWFGPDGGIGHLYMQRNGRREGPSLSFWTNGLLSSAKIYANGLQSGLSRRWWATGDPEEEGSYSESMRIGKHTFWLHRNHAKSHEIVYSTNEIPESATVWAADGKLMGVGIYRDGREWDGLFPANFKGPVFLLRSSAGTWQTNHYKWLEGDSGP
ncbi:MAG: hypothetical protein DVB31_15345 [Verrucomicrobia bacterium]|nr:MAG: hypothetical protein DVB31_15345 [Verrucomicrobiota bacterium]